MATTLWTLKEMRESLLRRKARLEAGRYETAHGAQFASKSDSQEWHWITEELNELDRQMVLLPRDGTI